MQFKYKYFFRNILKQLMTGKMWLDVPQYK